MDMYAIAYCDLFSERKHEMKKDTRGFTLIELLVVISIIALLMSILMPSLAKVKDITRTLVCTTQVRSWAQFYFMYTDGNQDKFFADQVSHNYTGWHTQLLDYYIDTPDLLLCPTTGPAKSDVYKAWGAKAFEYDGSGKYREMPFVEFPYYRSYSATNWALDPPGNSGGLYKDYYWRRKTASRRPERVPIFGAYGGISSVAQGGWPHDWDLPPNYPGEPQITNHDSGIRRYCMDRHNGYGCYSLMDGSARKIGMKELWTMKWHKEFDTKNIRTLANPEEDSATIARWNSEAPHWDQYSVF